MAIDTLLAEAGDFQDEAVRFRRTLHEHPELGLELPFTQERVLEAIDGLGLDVQVGETTTSVVATLDGAHPGPTILLRGDMDALPMPEDTGLDFSSRVEGAMHACGHDLHTTMLVGAARLLAARRSELAGSVRFMFQPGEEGHHGARYMLDEGLLDADPDRPVTGAFALHVFSVLPAGVVALKG
jgi:hippurate hydrolase